jgi:hypothetical protein
MYIDTKFEGQDLQRFQKGSSDAKQFTLQFWIKLAVQGTYVVQLFDTDNSRHVVANYTVSSPNTWEKKIITFPADTSGVLDSDNNKSFEVRWHFLGGSTYRGGTQQTTWGSIVAANMLEGMGNAVSATGDNFISGMQLEVGSVATDFEHRSFAEELNLCHRYYYLAHEMNGLGGEKPINLGVGENSSTICSTLRFPITMRSVPTMEASTGSNFFMFREDQNSHSFNSLTLRYATRMAAEFTQNGSVSLTSAVGGMLRGANDDSTLAFTAEL